MATATDLCQTVNFGSVGESGFQSVVSHVVNGPTSKIMVVRTVRSSLCPNTGAFAVLVANGVTLAHGDITNIGNAIQAEVPPHTRVTAVVHTFPLNNGIVCVRLGELEYVYQECQLERCSAPNGGDGVQSSSSQAVTPPSPPSQLPSSQSRSLEASTAAEATIKAYGAPSDLVRTGFTSHFNFDNRVFPTDPNPPATNKYCCLVECQLIDGSTSWFHSDDLRLVHVGTFEVLPISSFHRRVVRCRFWWRLNPHNQAYSSDWVVADPGNYIVYAFLVWHGANDYERPIYNYQESLH